MLTLYDKFIGLCICSIGTYSMNYPTNFLAENFSHAATFCNCIEISKNASLRHLITTSVTC